jgi:DnaJ family protein C protein 13
MRAVAERGAAAAAPMRDAALREGALLQHLQLALFAAGERGVNGPVRVSGLCCSVP